MILVRFRNGKLSVNPYRKSPTELPAFLGLFGLSLHEPLSAMANDTHRVLWCLMKNSSNPFKVNAPVKTSFGRLKDLVWEKHKNGVLQGTDATDLVLWKVSNVGLAGSSQLTSYLQLKEPVLITDLPNHTYLQGNLSQCAIELQDPSETVLDKFSEVPQARSVHIIVEHHSVGELTSACPLAFSLIAFASIGIAGPLATLTSLDPTDSNRSQVNLKFTCYFPTENPLYMMINIESDARVDELLQVIQVRLQSRGREVSPKELLLFKVNFIFPWQMVN
jgi:hypothetical protein